MRTRTNSLWLLPFLIALFSILIALYTVPPSYKTSINISSRNSFEVSLVREVVRQSGEFIYMLTRMVSRLHHRHHCHHQRRRKHKCDPKWRSNSLIFQYKVSLVLTVDLKADCANFSSVQKAIDVVPDSSPSKTLIVVYPGTYGSLLKRVRGPNNLVD
ncbi:hypothetical protein DITRI_Ditri06bG0054400 [Diplodiscus trichospermus]